MHMVVAPIPEDLANAVQPFRKKYDPLADMIPPHIIVVQSFEYTGPVDHLHEHLAEIGETHAPIKVSLVGWDIQQQEGCYYFRLPIIAGKTEFTTLRNNLLSGPLEYLARPHDQFWPHVPFGQSSNVTEVAKAKERLKQFVPQFIFRATYLELWCCPKPTETWRLQKKFGLEATLSSSRRRTKTSELLRLHQPTKK